MKRLSSLDYLRGIAACGVMVFHYTMWNFGFFRAEDFFGRVGLYGVAVFYVLSGMTLHHVYFGKIGNPSPHGLRDFAIKRVFRIFPLLWLMTLFTFLIRNDDFTPLILFLNFSGLFCLYGWKDTVAYGGWSIANELFFYLSFPLLVFLAKKSRSLLLLFSGVIFAVFLWFAFFRLDNTWPLGDYLRDGKNPWQDYTNPVNQFIFFLSGYLIVHFFGKTQVNKVSTLAIIVVSMIIFTAYPVSGDSMLLITGLPRVVFTVLSIAICFAFLKTDFDLPKPLHIVFTYLGDISYAVYLAHPVVKRFLAIDLKDYYFRYSPQARMISGIVISLLFASLLHYVLERPFMNLGKKISRKYAR